MFYVQINYWNERNGSWDGADGGKGSFAPLHQARVNPALAVFREGSQDKILVFGGYDAK